MHQHPPGVATSHGLFAAPGPCWMLPKPHSGTALPWFVPGAWIWSPEDFWQEACVALPREGQLAQEDAAKIKQSCV